MRSTVLQDSSSAQRRGEGSFGVAGHQSCISYRSPRALDNRDIESIAGTVERRSRPLGADGKRRGDRFCDGG